MRKTLLYAPRLVGDLSPGREPTRLDGKGNKALARMDFPGLLLPGEADHDIYHSSPTQKFEIGTRRVEYGRTFRYAKCGTNTTKLEFAKLLFNGNYAPDVTGHENIDGYFGKLTVAADAGDMSVELNDTGVPDRAANFYQGGYLQCHTTGDPYNTYYIVASDASTATGTVIYLDHPLIQDIPLTRDVEVLCSPYSNIEDGVVAATWLACVGRGLCEELTAGEWFWLQTEGPCWVQPTGWNLATECPGYAAYKRDVYVNVDGTIIPKPGTAATEVGDLQRVGYLLAGTASTKGAAFIMLQLE